MDRAFQYMLRVALVLCILAGVGLVVYQIVEPGPLHLRAAKQPAPPQPVPAVAPHAATPPVVPPVASPPVAPPAAQPGTPAAAPAQPAATPPVPASEQETAAAPAVAGATPGAAQPKASQMTIKDWAHTFVDREKQRDEGKISGQEAVIRSDNAVDILMPILVAYAMATKPGESVDVGMGEVHVTAKNGNVDKDKGLVQLFNEVKAEGKDFVVKADHVLYNFTDRTLATDSHVEMERDNVAADGTKTPAMTLTGDGLDVDMNLQTMKVRSGVNCTIPKVTQDFLAGGPQPAPAAPGAAAPAPAEAMDVVITCDGPMVYQNTVHKATFTKNVKAEYGPKTLTCDEMTVQLGPGEGAHAAGKTTVTDMFASGNVTLDYQDQVAHGQSFDWHNTTQSGTLVGEPCDVTTPLFRMVGGTLTFYRTDTRFDAKGPGQLVWSGKPAPNAPQPAAVTPAPQPPVAAAAPKPPATATAASAAAATASPFSLSKDQPVTIEWKTSMSYEAPRGSANFLGSVVAQQTDSTLHADQLTLAIQPETHEIVSVTATGNVDVRTPATAPASERDILCQEMVWDAQADTVELTAPKGQAVTMTQGLQTITSPHVVFDNKQGILECPAPGHLTMAPPPQPAGAAAEPALPTSVDWQTAMRFVQQPQPVATFSGTAVAQRGDQSIKGESLRLDFDKDMKPVKITAQGGAVLDVSSAQGLPVGALGAAPAPAQPVPAAQPAPAAPPAAAGEPAAGPNRWRLAAEMLIIEPPDQRISSDVPGTLTVQGTAAQNGTISWQKQMRLESAQSPAAGAAQGAGQSTAHFVGGVTSDMTGGSLKCDDLTANFDQDRKLRYARCEGNVEFDATGDNPWKMKSATADAVFKDGVLQQVISRGDDAHKVEVVDQTRTLLSRLLTLILEQAADGSNSISRAVAEQDVSVTYNQDPPILATGDKLVWDRVSNNYTLTGEPRARLIRGGIPTSSSTIVISRPTGASPGGPLP